MTALMTAAAPAALSREFPDVLAGVALDGAAADLAGLLDPGFLSGAGWDPGSRVLSPPAEHRLLGRPVCRVSGCTATMRPELGGVCGWCCTRLAGQGLAIGQIASMTQLPPLPARPAGCAVPGCGSAPPSPRAALCMPHYQQHRRMPGVSVERFAADPRPRPPSGPCLVAACSRMADSGNRGYCAAHYQRWRAAARTTPDLDPQRWQATEPEVAEGGRVSLRGLAPLTVTGVLLGAQEHTRQGAKITDVCLRAVCDTLRRQQAASIEACDAGRARFQPARLLLAAMVRHVRRARADPASEQARDVWDLVVFGHRGNLSFTGLSQGWLREAAKRWAAGDLPRHRGAGVKNVQSKVNALTRLSESLRSRDDGGLSPAALGRPDIEAFLSRLAYLESEAKISRRHRNVICRGTGVILAGIRALGLTRPGQPAAGLPGDFTLGRGDIPAGPARGEPGRDLPPEIMTVLCASLDTLQPAEVRAATQIGIDTGRRPEDILGLPLDCLARDSGGTPVLVYDNAKAGRLSRRLPISEATATVITGQQARVRARFPGTPASELKLLPSPRRNPDGRRHISLYALDERHREWVTSLGTLRGRGGGEFDPARVTPYAYRHTYAQRHADAGVPIDVLAELLDHRNLNVTRGYYRVGEDRRRAAVDKVTALSFDRHGNRIWRDAAALLESEHARYAVGEVAVPYGTCTEPSNVQAGGGACPIRFRCAGCDHFRTDVSRLPDLTAYLDDLLRTRERLTAAIDGVDEWARADATPAQEEITRIRRLISRIKGDITQLPAAEHAQIDEAVTVIRKHRAVSLGMPSVRAVPPSPKGKALA
ncbi:MAG TPA: tyrosine-type recombinase/integrase [Streptosporangiaceae bacterium]|nr:tyrosine-type recombinase/integrase [Streptosporangiaceae bacterium]